MSTVKGQMTRAVSSTAKTENNTAVGKTYGERSQRQQLQPQVSSQSAGQSRFLSDKNKQEALENFGANDRFQKGLMKTSGAGGTPYKTQRIDFIEKGISQALSASDNYRPGDDALNQFLDEVIGTPALHSKNALRNHLLARNSATKKPVA